MVYIGYSLLLLFGISTNIMQGMDCTGVIQDMGRTDGAPFTATDPNQQDPYFGIKECLKFTKSFKVSQQQPMAGPVSTSSFSTRQSPPPTTTQNTDDFLLFYS